MTTPRRHRCAWCGQPTHGDGIINGRRYCHEGPDPTCYMRACWSMTTAEQFHTPRRPDQHDQEAT